MNRAMGRAVIGLMALLAVATSSAGVSANAAPVSPRASSSEHCYRQIATIYHSNRDATVTRWASGGVGLCVRGSTIVKVTPMAACESPTHSWTCRVRTSVLHLAGHRQLRRVLTVAKLTPTAGSSTHSKTMVVCFHINSAGGVRIPCRITPSTVTSGDEQCFVHTSKTYRFNRDGVMTRWGNGGVRWCSRDNTMLSTAPIAHCGSPGGLWRCSAVTSITPLAGHPQQRRSFTLAAFHRAISGVTHRKGMTECFHFRTNGGVRPLCRIDHP